MLPFSVTPNQGQTVMALFFFCVAFLCCVPSTSSFNVFSSGRVSVWLAKMSNEAPCTETHLLFIPHLCFFLFVLGAAQRKASISQLHHAPARSPLWDLWSIMAINLNIFVCCLCGSKTERDVKRRGKRLICILWKTVFAFVYCPSQPC